MFCLDRSHSGMFPADIARLLLGGGIFSLRAYWIKLIIETSFSVKLVVLKTLCTEFLMKILGYFFLSSAKKKKWDQICPLKWRIKVTVHCMPWKAALWLKFCTVACLENLWMMNQWCRIIFNVCWRRWSFVA